MSAMAHLVYVIKGDQSPAAYAGLEKQRVAVVCVSDASAYGPDTLTSTINRIVGLKLATNVKGIDVVPPMEVNNWIDNYGWDESNFVELGRGVKADKVLAIEIASYSIHEGSTIYKGRADVTATVFNVEENGKVEYVWGPKLFQFPENGRPAIQTTDRQFETFFLARLTEHIARQFYEHDRLDTFAEDALLE